ncbi:MAG: ATP-binding cassette domain-containing protein [Actinomycetes bacterium]
MAGSSVAVELDDLTKTFGDVLAVDHLSFRADPGRVTGFLGPNGAGKTTTLRALVGLVAPSGGAAHVGGRRYADLAHPAATVGAALDAGGFHPGRTARNHLRVVTLQSGLTGRSGRERVDTVLAQVGLTDSADRRVGGFSTGMRQRLGLATALVADPDVLLLDEPANGLDPEGIAWLRGFLRFLADRGRTVLVSSHALSEVAQIADDVVIIDRGRLVRAADLDTLMAEHTNQVLVRTSAPDDLQVALAAQGHHAVRADDALVVSDATAVEVGDVAARAGLAVHWLVEEQPDLEDVFLRLIHQSRDGEPS